MEYKLEKTTIPMKEYILDTVSEQPVDVDVTLPDYCPDIEKILKCSLIPRLYSKNVSGGELRVDGAAVIRVLYVDSVKRNIRCFEHTSPYSASFPLKSAPEQYICEVDAKPEYINCRALSPRKLSLHGAFSLYAKVIAKARCDFFSAGTDEDLQVKSEAVQVCALTCLCEEQFSHAEDIPLDGNPPVEAQLQSEVSVRITDLKSIRGKLMLSAQAELKLMYLSDLEKGTPEHLSYAFPISRVIDCEGVDDKTILCPSLTVMTYDIGVNRDALSEGNVLVLDLKLCFSALGFEEKSASIIADTFSTERGISVERAPMNVTSEICVRAAEKTDTASLSLTDGAIAEVVDISCGKVAVTPTVNGDTLHLSARATVCILMKNSDGEPGYLERSVDVNCSENMNGFERVESAKAEVDSLSYRIVDEKMVEVRMKLNWMMTLSKVEPLLPVVGVTAPDDAENTPKRGRDCSLIIYFADEGENVWDIAKSYFTRPSALVEENSLDSDTIGEARMLLIPTE